MKALCSSLFFFTQTALANTSYAFTLETLDRGKVAINKNSYSFTLGSVFETAIELNEKDKHDLTYISVTANSVPVDCTMKL